MQIAIVYDSNTGTTARAARAMARAFTQRGHCCLVSPVLDANPGLVAQADLICVGSWTQGLLLFGQHATRETMAFVERMGDLDGKQAVVFCTYKIATGQMLPRMARALEQHRARVCAQFKFRGDVPSRDFTRFVDELAAPEPAAGTRLSAG